MFLTTRKIFVEFDYDKYFVDATKQSNNILYTYDNNKYVVEQTNKNK